MNHIIETTVEASKFMTRETVIIVAPNGQVVGRQTTFTEVRTLCITEEVIPVIDVEVVAVIPVDVIMFDPDGHYAHLEALTANGGDSGCDVELVYNELTDTVEPRVKQ